jgi:hypothetical protein
VVSDAFQSDSRVYLQVGVVFLIRRTSNIGALAGPLEKLADTDKKSPEPSTYRLVDIVNASTGTLEIVDIRSYLEKG